jgi:hypothetical protein
MYAGGGFYQGGDTESSNTRVLLADAGIYACYPEIVDRAGDVPCHPRIRLLLAMSEKPVR